MVSHQGRKKEDLSHFFGLFSISQQAEGFWYKASHVSKPEQGSITKPGTEILSFTQQHGLKSAETTMSNLDFINFITKQLGNLSKKENEQLIFQ